MLRAERLKAWVCILLMLAARSIQDIIPLTYWIDNSCRAAIPNIDDVMREASLMHRRALTRFQTNDMNQLRAFAYLFDVNFQVTPNDPAKRDTKIRVGNVHYEIGSIEPTANFLASNIRVYCDLDPTAGFIDPPNSRWQPVPDRTLAELAEGELPNSQKPLYDREYYDYINRIRWVGYGLPGCAKYRGNPPEVEPENAAQAWTFNQGQDVVPDQPNNRAVISICGEQLELDYHVISQMGQEMNFAAVTAQQVNGAYELKVDDLEIVTSVIMAHELTHHPNFFKQDLLEDGKSYNWENLIDRTLYSAQQSLQAAEAYTLNGLIGRMADFGLVLAPNELEGTRYSPAKALLGVLVYNGNTPNPPDIIVPPY